MEMRTHHIHTQHRGGARLIVYLHPNGVARVGWEPTIGSWCCRRKTIPRKPASSNNFLRSRHGRKQVSVYVLRYDGPEFGNEKRAHVENIDTVKSTEKLEALGTCLLDISGDVIGF